MNPKLSVTSPALRRVGVAALLATTLAAGQVPAANASGQTDRPVSGYIFKAYFETADGQPLGGLPDDRVRIQAVASGYKLRGTNRVNNYVYNTDKLIAVLARCNTDGCTKIGRVAVSVKQNVYGGSSTRWNYTVTTQYVTGPRYSAEFTYQCARNIKSDPDKYCEQYRDGADGFDTTTVAPRPGSLDDEQGALNADFGREIGKRKYALVGVIVRWDDYNTAALGDDGKPGLKFRMWDTKRFSADDAHLEPATGTGG